MLWALGVLAEIVLFALSARLPAAFTPSVLILIGGAGALIRWIAMAFGPPGALLPLLQCLHGLSFGATHLGTLAFIGRAAPAGLAATAQGYLAVFMGVAMAAATGLSGLLYGRFGAAAYGAMALVAAAGVVAALAAHRIADEDEIAKLLAGPVHRGELAAGEIFHLARETAALGDPFLHVLRIDLHQQLRAAAAGDRAAVLAGMPGGVEAEPRAARDADAVSAG